MLDDIPKIVEVSIIAHTRYLDKSVSGDKKE